MPEYTIREAARVLGFKVRTVRQWIIDGKIKAKKRGKCWMISEVEIAKRKGEDDAYKN